MVFEQFNENTLHRVQKNNKLMYLKSMNCFKKNYFDSGEQWKYKSRLTVHYYKLLMNLKNLVNLV